VQSSNTGSYQNERSWLRFDVSKIPAGATVTGATLQMWCWSASGPALPVEVHSSAVDTWGETTINWNNQPTLGPVVATSTLASGAKSLWYSWDVSSSVQSQLKPNGDGLVTLMVKAASESQSGTASSFGFDSKEYGGGTIPVLHVTIQPPPITVDHADVYYRYSSDDSSWGSWIDAGATPGTSGSIPFSFANGYGYYEFYSAATDSLGAQQSAVPMSQTAVYYSDRPAYDTTAYVTLGTLAQTYDGAPKPVTVTTVPPNLTNAVTYNGATDVPVHAGSYAISATVNQPGYSGNATGTLVVSQAGQTITFAPLAPVNLGVVPFAAPATSDSGLAVTLASSNTSVATVSGTTITVVGLGTTTITASQAGDADHLAATPISQDLVVNPAIVTATVTLSGLQQTYDGNPKMVGVTTSPPGLAVTVTYDGGTSVPVHAGSYAVNAVVTQSGYSGSAAGTLVIGRASQTIALPDLGSVALAAPPFAVAASSSSGLPVTLTSSNPAVATVSGTTVTVVGAGTTTITASQAGDSNYLAAPPVSRDLVVSPEPIVAVPAAPTWALLGLAILLLAVGAVRLPRRRGTRVL